MQNSPSVRSNGSKQQHRCHLPTLYAPPPPPPLLWYACIQFRQARGVESEWPYVYVTQAHFADSKTKMLKRLVAD